MKQENSQRENDKEKGIEKFLRGGKLIHDNKSDGITSGWFYDKHIVDRYIEKIRQEERQQMLKEIERIEKVKEIKCSSCNGTGYAKQPDKYGKYGRTCNNYPRCRFGVIDVSNNYKFKWEELKSSIEKQGFSKVQLSNEKVEQLKTKETK